ncbi:cell division protein FtsH [candidate division CPR3 bacterium GWF2_35_18]|nr:MAG: cell division protein FtsH [candidate division CPR3 bacterium GWF2_35_18]OGB65043.1 MAG: cell division protein FtsH [candidate division CPR3 bacterium RIFOXYA2_FULL_35_13]OGB78553.1 MAG: cell division protein FtsH [candidate division CPR3 bacterium RIFOXYB2_FULL_35_8]OGB79730.1 MAG: cell division protein FtsH [candidate division CPR3 bacterium GWE2_35_7]
MFKGIIIYIILAVIGLYVFYTFFTPSNLFEKEVPLTEIAQDIKDNKVEKVFVTSEKLTVNYKDGQQKISRISGQDGVIEAFKNLGVDPSKIEIKFENTSTSSFWVNLIAQFFPVLLMIVFFFIIMRQAQSSGSNILSFGKSKAKLFTKDKTRVTFNDAAGVEEAKKELQEVVEFLKYPKKFTSLGAKIPRGVLLVGAPGTGKTLLARAVAGEAGVPFFSIAGSEFMEMLVGVGASRVRDLFGEAKKNAPAILFIDELDAIGRQRGAGIGGGHDEREQTLNQILVEMDGFDQTVNVIVIAATNRPDILDPALMRPGRFDRRVVINYPDMEGRKGIIKIHMKKKPITEDVNIDKLARRTVGFSGADLENMLNEAAILAASQGKNKINAADIEEAATKVKLGPEKKRLQTEEDREIIAYHESGHAVTTYFLPQTDPVHRISIVSRGLALGYTMTPPQTDRYNENKTRLLNQIATLLGGRAAEEIVFNEQTVGASSDIETATGIAREMVCRYGMSTLGPIMLGEKEELIFLSRDLHEKRNYSEEFASKIDVEIEKIINQSYNKAKEILIKNRNKLDLLAQKLMKQETVESEEFEKLMQQDITSNNQKSKKSASKTKI